MNALLLRACATLTWIAWTTSPAIWLLTAALTRAPIAVRTRIASSTSTATSLPTGVLLTSLLIAMQTMNVKIGRCATHRQGFAGVLQASAGTTLLASTGKPAIQLLTGVLRSRVTVVLTMTALSGSTATQPCTYAGRRRATAIIMQAAPEPTSAIPLLTSVGSFLMRIFSCHEKVSNMHQCVSP